MLNSNLYVHDDKQYGVSKFVNNIIKSGVSFSISQTIIKPFTMMESRHSYRSESFLKDFKNYIGFLKGFGRVFKLEGLFGIYRNNLGYIIFNLPSLSLSFAINEYLKPFPPSTSTSTTTTTTTTVVSKFQSESKYFGCLLLSGGISAVISQIVTYPFIEKLYFKRKHSPLDSFKQVCLSLPSIFIYRSIYFGGYEYCKSIFNISRNKQEFNFTKLLLIANAVNLIATITTSPLVSVQYEIFHRKTNNYGNNRVFTFSSLSNSFKNVSSEKRLFKNIFSRSFQSTPCALALVLFDWIKIS